ncbi:MAG TPA: hypothetical protein VJG90_03315 [Candidatus Nanoarchaeia archaeon]|nr:hypothetical protein [Candidatus Nanoarchaeia archaeon]
MGVSIACRRCGRSYPQSEMCLDASGSDMLCRSCFGRTHDEKGKKVMTTSYEDVDEDFIAVQAPKPKEPSKPIMPSITHYRCPKCNFKFSRSPSTQVKHCPYCGNEKIITNEKLDAGSLLREASGSKYDF